jgi:PAS domain S-box-containing protein
MIANRTSHRPSNQKSSDLTKEYLVDGSGLSVENLSSSLTRYMELYAHSERKYRDFYENSLALYRTINIDGIIIDCNKSYAKRLGYTKEECIGMSIFQHTDEKYIDAMTESFETWKKRGKVRNREIWLKRKDGTTFPALVSATNLYDEDDKLIGSNTIIKDISDIYEARKKEEREALVQIQFEEVKKLEKLKDEFSSMMTHELKTPLTPIMGRCEMLKEPGLLGNLNEQQLDSVNKIQQNARRFDWLIRNILDAQKLEIRKMRFDKERIDISELMAETYSDYLPLLSEKEINFVNSTEQKLVITSDKLRIRQVIENLIQNAADFTPKGGRIEISAKDKAEKVLFSVSDNGEGISSENQSTMFKKFFQADTSLTRKHAGMGLGLVVCKGIVEGLGGEIWFESKPGIGTNFYFTIPKEL